MNDNNSIRDAIPHAPEMHTPHRLETVLGLMTLPLLLLRQKHLDPLIQSDCLRSLSSFFWHGTNEDLIQLFTRSGLSEIDKLYVAEQLSAWLAIQYSENWKSDISTTATIFSTMAAVLHLDSTSVKARLGKVSQTTQTLAQRIKNYSKPSAGDFMDTSPPKSQTMIQDMVEQNLIEPSLLEKRTPPPSG